jgi:hypothetical protein
MKAMSKMLLAGIAALAAGARVYGSEAATGVINLQSISGSGASTLYTYDITLKDTGTTDIGTFWYAWLPPDNFYDFLKSKPTAETSPTGWVANLEGENNGSDDNSIQWVANSNPLTPGSTFTYDYTTPDSPASVTGPSSPFGYPTGYSYIYIAGPETDPGSLVNVAAGTLTLVPEPATISLLAIGAASLVIRRPRKAVVPVGA